MNNTYLLGITLLFVGLSANPARSQNDFLLDDPGKLFRKSERPKSPPVKTRYFFDVGETSGREYLKQQDLLDPKGNFKSSGVFSENGNKSGDIRYTYDATGKLNKSEQKLIGQNKKVVCYYDANGLLTRLDSATKGDTVLSSVVFTYADKALKEEQFFASGHLQEKKVYDNKYNNSGKPTQLYYHIEDSAGNIVPGKYPLTVNEYDDKGMILQTTVYSNKEKRKMLSWIYYKYQLDNDYKVIKQTGYNEEQQEIYRDEITYTDSSVISVKYDVCNCPEKNLERKKSQELVFNSFGELIAEKIFDANEDLIEKTTRRYDDFGSLTETHTVRTAEPDRLIKSRTILEYYTDQAKAGK